MPLQQANGPRFCAADNLDSRSSVLAHAPGQEHQPRLENLLVTRIPFEFHFARPLRLPERSGTSIFTSLRGLFLRNIAEMVCIGDEQKKKGAPQKGHWCSSGDACPSRWLTQPRSQLQRRDHSPPFVLRIEQQQERFIAGNFWLVGQRAANSIGAVLAAVGAAGATGVIDEAGRNPWRARIGQTAMGTLGDLRPTVIPPSLYLQILGAQCVDVAVLAKMLGRVAHDMAQFQFADAEDDLSWEKTRCDAAAEALADQYIGAVNQANINWWHLEQQRSGLRRSGRGEGRVALGGVDAELSIQPVSPQLAEIITWASLWGVGGRKSFGQGRLKAFTSDGEPWLGDRLRAVGFSVANPIPNYGKHS